MELLETILHSFVNLAMLLFEYIGVGVITFAGIQGIVNYVKREPDTRLVLAQGLAMGLEFKLGSEILRTVVVRSLSEIAIVGSIIALRAVLTILIHWEIKNEVSEHSPKEEHAEVAVTGPESSVNGVMVATALKNSENGAVTATALGSNGNGAVTATAPENNANGTVTGTGTVGGEVNGGDKTSTAGNGTGVSDEVAASIVTDAASETSVSEGMPS